jgi:hypothetical protein
MEENELKSETERILVYFIEGRRGGGAGERRRGMGMGG